MAFLEGVPFADVLKRAKAVGRPVFVDMYADWCGPCRVMDATVFADQKVADWMARNVVAARVDTERGEGRKLSYRYAVSSLPTFLILDSSGNEIDRLLGAHAPARFLDHVGLMASGNSRIPAAFARLRTDWDEKAAFALVQTLVARNDLPRVRPLVSRLVKEDPDAQRDSTLEAFWYLAALEDVDQKLSPESADLVATYLPRFGSEPRRALLAAILARQQLRDGEAKEARTTCESALKAIGSSAGTASDLWAVIGAAEKKLGRGPQAVTAFRKGAELAEEEQKPAGLRAARQLDLAEALAAQGAGTEAADALSRAEPATRRDPAALARVARIRLILRESGEALSTAKRAVELSGGEDAEAQAALGASLAATGDRKGATAAYARALALAPANAEIRREANALRKRSVKTRGS